MQQFSVRLSDERGAAVRRLAAVRERSVNQTFEDLVAAATDPAHAASELAGLRERLSRAGLVFDVGELPAAPAPDEAELLRARAAAGGGTPLSELVSEGRR
jgi:predicted transcriptional regulator